MDMRVTPVEDSTDKRQGLERKILRKLDVRILPLVTLLVLAAFLDRSNIGNAAIAGLEVDLHLHGTQFNSALSLFFITYILSELPSNILLKKLKPNRWIAFLVAGWGVVTIVTGVVQNYAGLVAVRFVLGIFEGGLTPGVTLYLSCMYKRHELQFRASFMYLAICLAGFIGGFLASAILKMDGVGNLAGWRWIFILEGIVTTMLAVFTFFLLPSDVESALFLTEEEREHAVWRLKQDMSPLIIADPESLHVPSLNRIAPVTSDRDSGPDHEKDGIVISETKNAEIETVGEEGFEWKEVRRGIFDIQTWLIGIAACGLSVSLNSIGFFLPTIVRGLGYSGTEAQLRTVPPYALAAFLTLAVSVLSDRLKLRGPLILIFLPLTIIGYILAIFGKTNEAKYAGCCFMAAGVYSSYPCLSTVLANNTSGHYKRASATGVLFALASVGGLIGSFLYSPDQQPRYIKGHSISLAFAVLAWVFTAINVFYCKSENKARREGRRDGNVTKYLELYDAGLTKAPIGDRHPNFMFTL